MGLDCMGSFLLVGIGELKNENKRTAGYLYYYTYTTLAPLYTSHIYAHDLFIELFFLYQTTLGPSNVGREIERGMTYCNELMTNEMFRYLFWQF